MRIVIDLDGTICELKKPGQTYADVAPLPGAQEKISKMKAAGHTIIIYTARHMKTCEGDIAKVIERVGQMTRDWLTRHNIPYDELIFGKPYGHVYIDDLGLKFSGWSAINHDNLKNYSPET